MTDPHASFQAYLKNKRLKATPQRRLVLDVFLSSHGHLSTEELYEQVKTIDPSVGQTTVYRTMKLLADSSIAREVHFGDGVARYEKMCGASHHDHLICESCGRNIEVVDSDIERLQEQLAVRHGFVLTSHRMYLYGLCPDCRTPRK
mgnify:FL=1